MKKFFKDVYVGDILYIIDNNGYCLKAKIIEYKPNQNNDEIFIKIISARGRELYVVNAKSWYHAMHYSTIYVNLDDAKSEIKRICELLEKRLNNIKMQLITYEHTLRNLSK